MIGIIFILLIEVKDPPTAGGTNPWDGTLSLMTEEIN